MKDYMFIASFDELQPAEVLCDRLRGEGFDAELRDESTEQIWQLYNLHPRGQFKVVVPTGEADRVLPFLRTLDPSFLSAALRCPECGSNRVEYPQFSRRTVMGAIPAAAAAVGLIDRKYYCEACHFTWTGEPEPELTKHP